MPNTIFARSTYSGYSADAHANLIEQKWSRKMFKHALGMNPMKAYMGQGDNNIIQVNKDFLKQKGDKITFALRALISGDGQGDDGTYEGNEEAMVFYDNSVTIHERGNSVKINGKMTEQRTGIPLRKQGRNALGEWYGRIMALDIMTSLSGLANKKFAGLVTGAGAVDATGSAIETVNQVALTSSYRKFYGGQTTAGVLTPVVNDAAITSGVTHKFGTLVISEAKRMAKQSIVVAASAGTILSPIRPTLVDGKPWYVMFISSWQMKDLRAETAWLDAQKTANLRGLTNPIFSGAEGIWEGVIIKVSDYIAHRYGEDGITVSEYFDSTGDACASGIYVARALFCGAQAGLLAFGQMPTWVEKLHDYKTKFGVHTDVIYGAKKSIFNSIEFGCITVDTAITPT